MADDGDIRIQGSGELVVTQDGMTESIEYRVLARSKIEALAKLKKYRGVFIGAPWFTMYVEQPDASVVCRELGIGGDPEAPYGGQGDYVVRANYQPRTADESVIGGPPIYRIQPSLSSAPVDIDADGEPITNSSGEPIDPPLTDLEDQEVLVVEWWKKYTDLTTAFQDIRPYRNAKNLVTWQGAAKGSFRCEGVSNLNEVEVSDGLWVQLRTGLHYREPQVIADLAATVKDKNGTTLTGSLEGWDTLYADIGRREVGAVFLGKRFYKPIMTEDGSEPVQDPVNLDGNGARLGDTASPVAIARRLRDKYLDFAALGI